MNGSHYQKHGRDRKSPGVVRGNDINGKDKYLFQDDSAGFRIRCSDKDCFCLPCKAFGVDACFARDYFRKGDTVVISGRIVSEPYKKEGTEQNLFFTGIQVRKSYLARHRGDDCSRTRAMTPVQDGTIYEEVDYSDLPPLPEEYLELSPMPEEEGYRQAYSDMDVLFH